MVGNQAAERATQSFVPRWILQQQMLRSFRDRLREPVAVDAEIHPVNEVRVVLEVRRIRRFQIRQRGVRLLAVSQS